MTLFPTGSVFAIAVALSIGKRVHGAFVPVSSTENLDHVGIHRSVQQACGDLECLNGGFCAEGHNYDISTAVCECTAASLIDEVLGMESTRFVGKTCEIEVDQEEYCPGSTNLFCVHGGTCRSGAENFYDDPCNCTEGFKGRHCEYEAQDVQEVCALTCNGKGECEHGFNPNSYVGANKFISINPSEMTTNFTHCVCDEGFAGPNCEFDYIKCDGSGRFCFHGSTCSDDGGCNCTTGGDGIVGNFCEFKATDSCESPILVTVDFAENMDIDPSNKMNQYQNPFCVNDGLCLKIEGVDEYFCRCHSGSSGPHCKIVPTLAPHESPTPAPAPIKSPAPTTNKLVMTSKPLSAGPPTPRPTWRPTRAPVESVDSQVSQNSEEDEDREAGEKAGIVLAVMFGVVIAMGITLYTLREPPAKRGAIDRENTGEQVSSENITRGGQSQDGSPGSEAKVTTAGDDVLPAVV